MLMSSYLASTRAYCRLVWVPYFFRSVKNIKPVDILWLIVGGEMEMLYLLFKIIPLIIKF